MTKINKIVGSPIKELGYKITLCFPVVKVMCV